MVCVDAASEGELAHVLMPFLCFDACLSLPTVGFVQTLPYLSLHLSF